MGRPELTPRERMCLEVIIDYFQEHGYAPTIEEIQWKMYYSSINSAVRVLEGLEDKGYIVRPKKNAPRAIKVVGMICIMEDKAC